MTTLPVITPQQMMLLLLASNKGGFAPQQNKSNSKSENGDIIVSDNNYMSICSLEALTNLVTFQSDLVNDSDNNINVGNINDVDMVKSQKICDLLSGKEHEITLFLYAIFLVLKWQLYSMSNSNSVDDVVSEAIDSEDLLKLIFDDILVFLEGLSFDMSPKQ